MSRAPTDTSSPVICLMSPAIRWAIGTPRLRTPTSAKSARPRLCSRISCEIRVSARLMRSASMTTGIFPSLRTHRPTIKESGRIISGSARHLFQDHLAFRFGIEGRLGALARFGNQGSDRGPIELSGVRDPDASHHGAAALQQPRRIRKRGAFEKIQVDPLSVDRDRVDDAGRLVGWTEPDDQGIRFVVNHLYGAGEQFAKLREDGASESGHLGR